MKDPKLPLAATEYISNRFRDEFLFEVKESKKVGGHWQFVAEVTKDDFIHTLCFDEKGKLVSEEAEPTFPADAHERAAQEDVPE